MMGDFNSSSAKEALEDLWLPEDNWTTLTIENQINLYKEFSFSPIFSEQGISFLEEISSVEENNEFSKQDRFSTPNDNIFVQQESDLCHNNNTCITSKQVNPIVQANNSRAKKLSVRKGFVSKTKERKSKIKNFEAEKSELVRIDQVEVEESLANEKKKDHNAKERIRRMKLHASYHALGSLLPMSKTSNKKEWAAPVIIDKVLGYIPELESEIEELTLKKNRIVSAIDENKRLLLTKNGSKLDHDQALTISVSEVKQGEMIIQVCKKREEHELLSAMVENNGFSKLLQSIEDERVRVLSASTLRICDERECYTFHIQMNGSTSSSTKGCEYIKQKFVTWLS